MLVHYSLHASCGKILYMSEFRQDCLGNYTIPSHPLATYVLTRLDTRSKLSEGDGDKNCEKQKEGFFPPQVLIHFCLILLVLK